MVYELNFHTRCELDFGCNPPVCPFKNSCMLAYRGPLLDMVYRGERGTLGVRWVRQQYEHILQISLDKDFPYP